MTKTLSLALLSCAGQWVIAGCDVPTTGEPASAAVEPKVQLPPPGSATCGLDPVRPGPMRRSGTVHVQLSGDGLAIDARGVLSVCGPMFNADVHALGVHAGDGVLFETCLPEGTLQITSWSRSTGQQSVHGTDEAGGTEVAFNKNKGDTYTTRGVASDRLVFSDDFWRAEADLALHRVVGEGMLHANLTFDCPPPGPWADAPAPQPLSKAP